MATPLLSPSPSASASPLPPQPRPRNIVLLLDGTTNEFGARYTNVIKMMSVLKSDDHQLIYYSSGVGTLLPEGASTWSKTKQLAATVLDMGLAWNFKQYVCDAYQYLMDYYQEGDLVYLMGFSRGAYTARALAGMIQKVGLLPPGNHNQVQLAWDMYTNKEEIISLLDPNSPTKHLSSVYRRIFGLSRDVSIHFIGVWDTVSSLGGLDIRGLPFAGGVKSVKFFRQALALDERRSRFVQENRHFDLAEPVREAGEVNDAVAGANDSLERASRNGVTLNDINTDIQSQSHPVVAPSWDPTQIGFIRRNSECWFMGCHSDVGGGNDLNDQNSVSNIPFRWMLREAEACGIQLDPVGIVLLPAISSVKPVVDQNLIPQALREKVEQQTRGLTSEAEDNQTIATMLAKHLSPLQLHNIVQVAATYDSAVERADEVDGQGPSTSAAGAAASTLSPDLLCPTYESLTWAWVPLEILYLPKRVNTDNPEGANYKWTVNNGKGRIMAEGQAIHRSVLKRLRYDRQTGHPGIKEYAGPKASLPNSWKVTWEDLEAGSKPEVWEY